MGNIYAVQLLLILLEQGNHILLQEMCQRLAVHRRIGTASRLGQIAELPLFRAENAVIAVDNRARRVDVAPEVARRRLLHCLEIGTIVHDAHDLPARIAALHAQLQGEL